MRRTSRARLGLAVLSGILATGALTAPAAAEDATATITGILTDSHGQRVADSFVNIDPADGGSNSGYAYTDENGVYTAAVEPGTYRVGFGWKSLTQWAYQKTTPEAADTFTVGAGETARVDDQLLATGQLGGLLTKQDGETPVVDAEVQLRRAEEPVAWAYTDESGTYRFDAVLPGEYQVAFYWGGGLQVLPGVFTVVADEYTIANGSLPPATTLVVKGVDSVSGAPVDGFCVRVRNVDAPACAGADGLATVTDLPAATVRFDVDGPEGSLYVNKWGQRATLPASETTTVTVPLVLGGTIAVTAEARATAQKVEDACFTLRAIGQLDDLGGGCTGADGTGKTVVPVTPGTYEIFVRAPGDYGNQWLGRNGGTGEQKAAARIVVKPGKVTKAPTVLLDPAGTITGVVTGADGQPMKQLNVAFKSAEDIGSGASNGVFTDASGRYRIGHLGPYGWPLLFQPDEETGYPYQWSGNTGNRFQAVTIPVTAGGSSTYDITLAKTSTLRGSVTPGDKEFRLVVHNAITGDVVGQYHGWPGGTPADAYEIPLVGGQQVTLEWNYYSGSADSTWYAGGKKISIPATGVKTLNLTHE